MNTADNKIKSDAAISPQAQGNRKSEWQFMGQKYIPEKYTSSHGPCHYVCHNSSFLNHVSGFLNPNIFKVMWPSAFSALSPPAGCFSCFSLWATQQSWWSGVWLSSKCKPVKGDNKLYCQTVWPVMHLHIPKHWQRRVLRMVYCK